MKSKLWVFVLLAGLCVLFAGLTFSAWYGGMTMGLMGNAEQFSFSYIQFVENAPTGDIIRLTIRGENYTILTEINNFTIIADWKNYSDLVALRGISLTNQNYSESIALAKYWYNFMIENMWDGNGFADKAYTDPNSNSSHIYQTYKLGLALILANNLKITNSSLENTIARIINFCQDPDGGVITGYEVHNGSIILSKTATANTETTAIIALANIQENDVTDEPTVDYLMWVIVVSVVAFLLGAIYLLRKFGLKAHNRIQLKKY